MSEKEVEELIERITKITPFNQRSIPLRKVKSFDSDVEWYDYLINDWIPNQPDSENLMYIYIMLNFNTLAFVNGLMGITFFEKYLEKLALGEIK